MKGFTGVDDPYEEPENPELIVETSKETIEESTQRILDTLEALGYLDPEDAQDESALVTNRLTALGYL
jgi:adenylylsulfate kinase